MNRQVIDPANPPAVYEWTGPTGVKFRDVREPSGTYYHDTTPRAVIDILERAMRENLRIRLFSGDPKTGRSWMSEWQTTGTVGRSTGWHKIPLLIHSARSMGGGAIMADCLVRIQHGLCVLWQHPNFYIPEIRIREIGPSEVCGAENLSESGYTFGCDVRASRRGKFSRHANFKSYASAVRWAQFMRGERLGK